MFGQSILASRLSRHPAEKFSLDTPLLRLSQHDAFTVRDACNGVHIFGGIGSGKTSGSGKDLAGAFLRAGMGGVVLCAKPEEVELWLRYAKASGRERSVVVFDGEQHGYNFIDAELARNGLKGTSAVVDTLMTVLEAAERASGRTGGGSSDSFWEDAKRQVIRYCVLALYAAYGRVSISAILDFVMSAATSPDQYGDAAWSARSFAATTLRKAVDDPAVRIDDPHQLKSIGSYWFADFPRTPEKTRGNVLISLSSCLDRFRHGRLRQAFADRTTCLPEMTFHGALIIVAMPALSMQSDGVIANVLMKSCWQRAVQARNALDPIHRERPIFLWADEAHTFVASGDDEFLSMCRGSRACVVYLSQSLPSYYSKLGHDKVDAADGLIGKFANQIFHLNPCNRTNTFASQLIGRGLQLRNTTSQSVGNNTSRGLNEGENTSTGSNWGSSHSTSSNGQSSSGSSSGGSHSSGQSWGRNISRGANEGASWSSAEQMDNLLEPAFFARHLKSGGPQNGGRVTAVWFRAGAQFRAAGGQNYLLAEFQQ
jgi:uncharacterized membrane protein YgcG